MVLGKALTLGHVESSSAESAVVVWLHGFGDSPGGWAQALQPFRTTLEVPYLGSSSKWRGLFVWFRVCPSSLKRKKQGGCDFWGEWLDKTRVQIMKQHVQGGSWWNEMVPMLLKGILFSKWQSWAVFFVFAGGVKPRESEGFMQAWFGCDVLQYFEDLRFVEFYFCHKALYVYI